MFAGPLSATQGVSRSVGPGENAGVKVTNLKQLSAHHLRYFAQPAPLVEASFIRPVHVVTSGSYYLKISRTAKDNTAFRMSFAVCEWLLHAYYVQIFFCAAIF